MTEVLHRFACYFRAWWRRGAATMDHGLWLYWAWHGKYPRTAQGMETRKGGDSEAAPSRSDDSPVA